MTKYFFDIHDPQGDIVDDEGVELSSLDDARREARQTIGEAGRTLMAKGVDGRVVVQVRVQTGPVLTVTAAFETIDN
ncbi:DUF6894 family protein [Bradyrhizobium guangdongense]|uniref:DUF6894 domain-containing protein n=1 Tax=Bradyrhizobium guangdongense TaxID=1325090 RepID=A0A410V7B4_9BRAD|nr:hypothetical protein [Bradyrhizobium guangdongense]QAU39601.1 hypothetical protein X265_19485 [Bradyrhizobium guangdongense]QOZ60663.1 hypothetical protein XH86_19500 [Bradyrhizobium guangdongense]GGI24163.1 hypothetical protein GCM10010987_28010 [Bradyrhizobium guangdongense]